MYKSDTGSYHIIAAETEKSLEDASVQLDEGSQKAEQIEVQAELPVHAEKQLVVVSAVQPACEDPQ